MQFGAAPTSRAGLELVRRAGRLVIVDQDHLVADPHRKAAWTLRAEPAGFVPDLLPGSEPAGESAWLRAWTEADERARDAVDATVDGWEEPFEGRIARDVAASVPDGGTLVVGSSMPVRDLDAYMRPRDGLRVLANRGASGIDGFVSTALGVSAAGAPTTALCGDLTLLHDLGSLIWSARRGYDCVFVVPNNDGGAIFSFLPQRELPEFEELFATPHGLELGAICRAAGAGHAPVERAADLIPAVERAREAGGVHVVEVPIDRARNVELHAAVQDAVAAALGPAYDVSVGGFGSLMVEIRRATPDDADELARLRWDFRVEHGTPVSPHVRGVRRGVPRVRDRRARGRDAWRAWVAEDAGRPVGCVWLQFVEKIPHPSRADGSARSRT